MKKLLIAGLLIAGISTFAQNRDDANKDLKERPKKEQPSVDQELKRLTSDLKLSEKQQKKIKKLLEERNTNQKGEKVSGTKRKPENQKEDQKKAPKDRNEFETKLIEILTKEQYQKWEDLKKSERPEKGKTNNPRAS